MLKREVNILNNQQSALNNLNNSQHSPPNQQSFNGVNPLTNKTYNNPPIFQNLPSGNNMRP